MQEAKGELSDNVICLDTIRKQMERNLDWPICRLKHVKIDDLFQNHFFFLGENAYGEDNTLIATWQEIGPAIDRRNAAKSVDELMKIEKFDRVTLRDLYFHQSFLIWYLDPRINDAKAQPEKNTPESFTNIPDRNWKAWPAKMTEIEGDRVENFADWLGYLD